MFSLLNIEPGKGKRMHMVSKILNSLPKSLHGFRLAFGRPFYLLEDKRLSDGLFLWVGLRIAFLLLLPTVARMRSGKA